MRGISLAAGGLALLCSAAVAQQPAVERADLGSNLFAVGTLRASQGALPPTLWRGADVDDVRFLLRNAPGRPSSPAAADLLRRTLLSPGASPDGADEELAGHKLSLLARTGSTEGARSVASLADVENDPFAARALVEADLADGRLRDACLRSADLKEGRERAFWLKLRVVCYAAADENEAADLTLGLLRDVGEVDEVDDALLSTIVTGRRPKSPPAPRSPLELAMARQAGLPVATALGAPSDASVLRALALDTELDDAARVTAARKAAYAGAISIAEARSVLQAPRFRLNEIVEAESAARRRPGDPRTDALLYQAISEMTAPELQERKIKLMDIALGQPETPERLHLLAAVLVDDIARVPPTRERADVASSFALALLAAGDGERAASWIATLIPGPDGRPADGAWKNPQLAADLTHFLEPLEPQLALALRGIAQSEGADVRQPIGPRIIELGSDDPASDEYRDSAAYAAGLVDALVNCIESRSAGVCALTAVVATDAPLDLKAMGDVVRDR
ncbi:MAG: hypothetical protein AAFV51_12985, partial [Pseudomonadota bacterium]